MLIDGPTHFTVEATLLVAPLVVLAGLGYLVLIPFIGKRLAKLVTVVKFGLSLAYFALLETTYWALGDGVFYYRGSLTLLHENYTLFELLYLPRAIDILVVQHGSQHVLYYWWNILTISLFGKSYQAPMLGNIFVSIFAGILFYHLLIEADKSERYARYGTVFFLLHWDILAWTTFTNLKGTLVMFFTMLIIVCLIKLSRRNQPHRTAQYVIGIIIAITALWWLRFYVPVLIFAAMVGWLVFNTKQVSIAHTALLLPVLYVFRTWSHALDRFKFDTVLFGLLRFPLTPQPWSVAGPYSFVQLSAVLHWIFVVPALFSAGRLFIKSKYARLSILYLCVVIVFYSLLPDLWGVRHRYQTTFVWAWLQFHFLWFVKDASGVRIDF